MIQTGGSLLIIELRVDGFAWQPRNHRDDQPCPICPAFHLFGCAPTSPIRAILLEGSACLRYGLRWTHRRRRGGPSELGVGRAWIDQVGDLRSGTLSLSNSAAASNPTGAPRRARRQDPGECADLRGEEQRLCVGWESRGVAGGGAYLPAGLAFELDVKEPPVELCKHKHPTDRGSQRAAVGTGHSIRTEGTCCSFQAPLWWTMQMTRNGGGDIIARWRHYSACCG